MADLSFLISKIGRRSGIFLIRVLGSIDTILFYPRNLKGVGVLSDFVLQVS